MPVETRGAGACSRQVNNFCAADSFSVVLPDRGGGADAVRQLVVVPPAQARRGPARRGVGAGGDLLLRKKLGRSYGGGAGWDTTKVDKTALRRVALSRCSPRPHSVTPAPVPHGWHGPSMAGAGLPPLLPQRDGRTGGRAGLGDPRRPRARVGPRHLGRPISRLIRARPLTGGGRGGAHDGTRATPSALRSAGGGPVPRPAAQRARRRRAARFAGCFGIFGHGNVAGVGEACSRRGRPRGAAVLPGPKRAGHGARGVAFARMRAGSPRWRAPPRSAPDRRTW